MESCGVEDGEEWVSVEGLWDGWKVDGMRG